MLGSARVSFYVRGSCSAALLVMSGCFSSRATDTDPSPIFPNTQQETEHQQTPFSFFMNRDDAVWQGEMDRWKLASLDLSVISTRDRWETVWRELQPHEAVPHVDFDQHAVYIWLVDAHDPNSQSVKFSVDEHGALSISFVSTLLGWTPSDRQRYYVLLIPRKGITQFKLPDVGK